MQDQGAGVAPEDISKIFGRFVRAINRNEVSGLGSSFYVDLPL